MIKYAYLACVAWILSQHKLPPIHTYMCWARVREKRRGGEQPKNCQDAVIWEHERQTPVELLVP